MRLLIDTTGLSEALGGIEAMAEATKDKQYLDALVQAAFNTANEQFNAEAAAAASAGLDIKHMFEWGTLGVNRGRTNMRAQPNSERARLWKTAIVGTGLNQTIAYTFKPSIAFVPKPTREQTGMNSQDIGMLRDDHIFHWKARVMESGEMVNIVRKEAKFLIVPLRKGMQMSARPSDVRRGYAVTKGPIRTQPGAAVQGNFTTFWTGYWAGRGATAMNKAVEKQFETDFFPSIISAKSTGVPKMPSPGTFKAKVTSKSKQVKSKATTKARTRRRAT